MGHKGLLYRPPSNFSLGDLRNARNKKIFKITTRYSEPFLMKDSILGQILLPLIAKLNERVRIIRTVREQQRVALLLFTDVLLSTKTGCI